MKKSMTTIAASLTLLMALSACGGNNGNNGNNGSADNSAAQPSGGSASAEAPAKEVTLRVTSWVPEMKPAMEKIGEQFAKENPGVTVDFSIIPGDQYENITKTKLLANDAPDLFFMFASRVDELAANGLIGELSGASFYDRLLPGFQKKSADGKLYALPVDYSAYGVFYNQDVFKSLNLTPPQTFAELLSVSETIKAAGIEPFALGAKDSWTIENMALPMYASMTKPNEPNFGKDLYDGKASMSDAAFKRPFLALAELQDKGYINKGALGIDYQQSVASVLEGKTAMIASGSYVVGTASTLEADAQLGYFPFPADEGDPGLLMIVDKSLVYSSKGKNPELAQKFIDFFARADIMKMHIEGLNAIPTLGDTNAALPQALLDLGASAAKFRSFSQGFYLPGRAYQTFTEKLLPEILTGKGATDARFAELDKQLKEELQNPKVAVPFKEQ